jgi:hypothetical protein
VALDSRKRAARQVFFIAYPPRSRSHKYKSSVLNKKHIFHENGPHARSSRDGSPPEASSACICIPRLHHPTRANHESTASQPDDSCCFGLGSSRIFVPPPAMKRPCQQQGFLHIWLAPSCTSYLPAQTNCLKMVRKLRGLSHLA